MKPHFIYAQLFKQKNKLDERGVIDMGLNSKRVDSTTNSIKARRTTNVVRASVGKELVRRVRNNLNANPAFQKVPETKKPLMRALIIGYARNGPRGALAIAVDRNIVTTIRAAPNPDGKKMLQTAERIFLELKKSDPELKTLFNERMRMWV